MIVRILGEGQFRVDSDVAISLNGIDLVLEEDLQQQHPQEFAIHLAEMQRMVRSHGLSLEEHELLPSDVILPADGSTLDEVRELLTADGLVPG